MATSSTIFKCDYCGYTTKTRASITTHETACKANASSKELITTEIDTIRTTATDIPHLISLLTTFWRSHGLEVTFTDYPSRWSDSVSNSHNAPTGYPQNRGGKPDLPKGYPGWAGSWKGTVQKLPTYKGTSAGPGLSQLRGDAYSSDYFHIPFFHTGSGSGGKDFSIKGMLFLYDFPVMYEQWKSELGEYKLLSQVYNTNIQALTTAFKTTRDAWVASQPAYIEILELLDNLAVLRSEVTIIRERVRQYGINAFTANNPIDIPAIPSAFIDNEAYKNAVNLNMFVNTSIPETANLFTRTSKLAETLAVYRSKFPEYFI